MKRRTANRRTHNRRRKGGKQNKSKKSKSGKKWVSAVDAAHATLKKTGSLNQARAALRIQAFQNARKLFGSVGESK
jgi:hypothetical protein